MDTTRRTLLTTSGAAGAAVAGLVGVPGLASAGADRAADYNVAIDYPEEWLQTYRPAFIADYHTMQRSKALYAHRARPEGSDVEYAYYWHRLTHQDGLSLGPMDLDIDGHLYDHEPVIVRVRDGEVERVVYTYYHHFADTAEGAELDLSLIAHKTDERTHIPLRIIDPWHHYAVEFTAEEYNTTFLDVTGDADASHLDTWERRGIFQNTASEAVYDPRTVADRGSWWDESTNDYRFASLARSIGHYIDIAGSADAIQS